MINAVKILLMLAIMVALSYPFIEAKGSLRKLSVASRLKYDPPHNRKNFFFVLLCLAELVVVWVIFRVFDHAAFLVSSIPFLGELLTDAIDSIDAKWDYGFLVVKAVLVNLVIVYGFIILKALLKKAFINPLYGIGKQKEKPSLLRRKKKAADESGDATEEEPSEEEKHRKRRRIPDFVHTILEDDDAADGAAEDPSSKDTKDMSSAKDEKNEETVYGPIASAFLSLFFEGSEFQYARNWVVRGRMILQLFVRLVQAYYLILLAVLLVSVFFPMPKALYTLLVDVLHVGDWYLYPLISVIFLQEICNVFDTPVHEEKIVTVKDEEEKKEERKVEAKIRALLAELKRRFDAEHSLRCYPEVAPSEIPPYECTNLTYASSMDYIAKVMEASSGRVVQSYMECLDAIYNDAHVYFAASFYSELGEYLIAYTYTRLLAGARLVFVVADPEEKETLRTYISDRLMKMTGSSAIATWRVYTADEHLDQADVLIASPSDFTQSNIAEHHPVFFEEVCNAIFIDADQNVSLDGYLCPIMATRLKRATDNRIRFVFLSLNLLKGFAERNLPKFFCVKNILSFSSAKENEAVSYILWNKESKKHRIYNKSGQKLTSLETVIAELAFQYGMDGVRLITEAPLGHAERQILALHDVEINKLFKKDVDVNYMIYSDDRCNLSAALYACTRFRGKSKSIVHILSKPYLLREYFMTKAGIEDYINRSSFIQPRVTEHVEDNKFSLLCIFCEATSENGLPIHEFVRRMKDVMISQKERCAIMSSSFCRKLIAERDIDSLRIHELAAYLIAGLCDNDPMELTAEEENACVLNSLGNRAKDYYLVIDSSNQNRFSASGEKRIIFNRVKEILSLLLACNRRVELRLNDEVIGVLDTFPNRVSLEYIAGQSIVFNNSEYEIEHIAGDGRAIYLRNENISIRNCLDTILLRHYRFEELEPQGPGGVLNNSKSVLEEIRVTKCAAKFTGTTFGFYGLTTDRQTLDFQRGVEGNPHSEHPNVRHFTGNAQVLRVSLKARMECNDGMRLLLSAVFNEFIKTIFPKAYHCIAICPILEKPLDEEGEDSVLNRIKTLYPFLKNPDDRFIETDPQTMQFLFINDCLDDVGVLEWFYDRSARYMQEFLANVYSYLHWLRNRPEKAHYIYYGGDTLPECFDLEGCCKLLTDFNLVLSDDGEKDFETAGDDLQEDVIEYCSFCHKPLESGRFLFFDKHRYICADCFDTVGDQTALENLYTGVREYLAKEYAEITFGTSKVQFDPVYDLTREQILSEFNSRVDQTQRTIYVEVDNPVSNACVSILRGIIALWQIDNSLSNQYAMGQLYFEEIKYLRSRGEEVSADWIYQHLPDEIRLTVDEITDYVNFKDQTSDETSDETTDGEQEDREAQKPTGERRTSFSFMRTRANGTDDEWDGEDPEDEEYSDDLYDPNKIPRFWKRYLRGQHIDDGREDQMPDGDEDQSDGTEDDTEDTPESPKPNAPLGTDEEIAEDTADDTATDDSDGEDPDDDLSDDLSEDLSEDLSDDILDDTLDDTSDDSSEDTVEDTADEAIDEKARKREEKKRRREEKKNQKKDKKKSKKRSFLGKTVGERILPYEEDEKTNPLIRVYNELVRAAYDYNEQPISRIGLSDQQLNMVFRYVQGDYPELFWVNGYAYTATTVEHRFRCKDANGRLDVKQINKKKAEIHRGAKQFTKGITRKTDPYEALLTIYRRLILTLDYDTVGLNAHIDSDESRDDALRSLYNALVNHKVVCAGYAVAMQYLLQSVGIVCGYVISENDATNTSCHAFNMLKIGKYCYYLDATWGDRSNTGHSDHKDEVGYDYFCVPYHEFTRADPASVPFHIPKKELYPNLETFQYTNHEYYRYHNAYLKSYQEQELVRIFAEAALAHDEEEMGRFVVSFRCSDGSLVQHVADALGSKNKIFEIIAKATAVVSAKDKKAAKYLTRELEICYADRNTGILKCVFKSPEGKKNKKA